MGEIDLSIMNEYNQNPDANIDMKDLQVAIQAANIIVRHAPTLNRIPIGPSIYNEAHNDRIEPGRATSCLKVNFDAQLSD